MRPPTEDDLILYYYGEAPDPEAVGSALRESPETAARYDELRAVLDAIPDPELPETPPDYPQRVWRQLQPRLEPQRPRGPLAWWPADRRWALAATVVLLVALGFVAGRFSSSPPPASRHQEPGQRILLVTVASHLERSEILLLELANARTPEEALAQDDGGFDVTNERRLARELSGANRLYRQAADKAGERRVAALLDDLERLLVEVAHAPDELQADRLKELQLRLEEADILFKIRVVGSRLRQLTDPEGRPSADAASEQST